MKTIHDNYSGHLNRQPFSLGWFSACLAVFFIPAASLLAQNTWNGGSATDSYWSDTANWGGTALITGNSMTFGGIARQINTNDIAGLTLASVTMSTANWNIQGTNSVILGGNWTASVSGTSTWGLDTTLSATRTFTQSATADTLALTGVISGPGGITKALGSAGQGALNLVNTNNSFTGQVRVSSGTVVASSLAPAGTNSSLGAAVGSSAPIQVGSTGTGYAGTLIYAGSVDSLTDRQLQFANNQVSPTTFLNNSSNNSSLTFVPDVNNDIFTFADGTPVVFPLVLAGSSLGTNTFMTQFGSGNPPYWGGNLQIGGSGTWAFSNILVMAGSLTVSNSAHFTLLYNSAFPSYSEIPVFSQITVKPGGTFDVSSYDQNSNPFVLGSLSGFPQIMTAGRTNSQPPAMDINGSLNLGGAGGATLNVASTGVPGTLTISSNLIPSAGTIKLDLGTNTTAGLGSNDLIRVGADLDLSQGSAVVVINPIKSVLTTNTPYTLVTYSGSLIGNVSGLSVPSPSRAYNPGVVTAGAGVVQVTFNPSGQLNGNLFWQGNANQNWDVQTTANWLNGGGIDFFLQGDNVIFNDSATQFNINVIGAPAPGTMTVSNNLNSYVVSSTSLGSIGGGSVVKQGTNELTLALADTYSGGTVISAGTVSGGNNSSFGTGPIMLGDGNSGPNVMNLLLNSGAIIANAVTVSASATNVAIIGYESGNAVTFNGPVTLQRNVTFYTTNPVVTSSLFIFGGISGTGDVTVAGGGSHKWQTGSCVFNGNIIINGDNASTATYLGINTSLSTNCNITVGTNAILGDVNSPNINALNGGGLIEPGFNAAFVATMNIGAANGSGTFSGSFTTNNLGWSCLINKLGTGTEILTGDNSLSGSTANGGGNTIVSGGTLAVNNAIGYGLGIGGVAVNAAGTLAGTGIIYASGNKTFVVSGVLSVGNIGDITGRTFTFTNTAGLTINSGGALNVDLFSGSGAGDNTGNAAAADVLNAQCHVTLNGGAILNVTNPNGMTAWAAGDKWQIINWNSMLATGTFTVLNLPTLPGNLAWDTTSLYSAGIIGIVASSGPTQSANILGITASGGNLVISGTNLNGGQNFHYAVLTSTNLTTPLANWTVLSTNSFNVDGSFNYTNVINPTNSATFFDVKVVQ